MKLQGQISIDYDYDGLFSSLSVKMIDKRKFKRNRIAHGFQWEGLSLSLNLGDAFTVANREVLLEQAVTNFTQKHISDGGGAFQIPHQLSSSGIVDAVLLRCPLHRAEDKKHPALLQVKQQY